MRGLCFALFLIAVASATPRARADGPGAVRGEPAVRCAPDEAGAAAAVRAIAGTVDARFGLPVDDPEAPVPTVHAARIDALLGDLFEIARRWPSLRTEVEQAAMAWNFCEINYGNRPWDLSWGDDHVVRSPAGRRPRWPGFARWGFLPNDPPDRYVPGLLTPGPLGVDQTQWFVGELRNARCFPHPDTGRTIYDDEPAATGDAPSFESGGSDAPLASCPPPPAPRPAPPPPGPSLFERVAYRKNDVQTPVAVTAIPTGANASAPNTVVVGQPRRFGFGGAVYYQQTLKGPASVGTGLQYTPWSYLFVRGGVAERLDVTKDAASYSWGIGYDDWHPGTFSLQVNDWGPRPFGETPELHSAALDLGYKVPLPTVIAGYVGAGVGVNVPFKGTPGAVAGVTLKPYRDFFVLTGVRFDPFDPIPFTFSYGFGMSNWRPFTFSLTYYNWGPNKFFVPAFVTNGAVSISFSWAF